MPRNARRTRVADRDRAGQQAAELSEPRRQRRRTAPGSYAVRPAGSASSTIDPFGARRYRGTSSARSARRTVFFETPSFRAIALIPRPSDRCSRRISAHSSKVFTDPFCHAQ